MMAALCARGDEVVDARDEAASPSDAELVGRARLGEERAFVALVERYQALLSLIAFRRTGRESDCEDVVQEALVRAFGSLAALKDPSRFRSWIAEIASNVALDRVRRRSPVVSFDQDSGLVEALPPSGQERPSAKFSLDEEKRRLAAAVESLPEHYQLPVVMRHVEGLSYREISRRLGVREDALRKRIHRAHETLERALSRPGRPAGREGDGEAGREADGG
jgi:RNA polymerase sigma-70 factor (ECF subfamily)